MKSASILQKKSSIWIALLVLVAIIIIGLGLINKISTIEKDQDISNWQYRLSLMIDVREDLLNNWLEAQYSTLNALAKNQSLQLYLSQISLKSDQNNTDVGIAQRTYLRSLLIKTARDNGFYENSPISPIKANIPVVKHSGVAILNADGEVIVTSSGMPLLDKVSIERSKEIMRSGNKGIRDIYLNEHAEQVIVFMVPVPSLTNTSSVRNATATIVGIRTLKNGLYPLLNKEIFSTETDATILVRRNQGSVTYLNKENTHNNEMFMQRPKDPEKLAAAYALDNPGAFAIRQDFSGKKALFVSRQIPETNWLLLQTISADEALKDSDARQESLITSFSYGFAALIFIIIASWRHGASLYAQKYAGALEEKSTLLTQQKNMLESITNNTGDLILLIDKDLHIQFSNLPTSSIYKLEPTDLIGKTLISTFGNEIGNIIQSHVINTQTTNKNIISIHEFQFDNIMQTHHSSFFPVNDNNILVVLHDITELKNAQNKHERLMKHLVQTLTHVIDTYDPNCENHSSKTTKIAKAIAAEINLSSHEIETLELSASLANIGKLFIPKEILTKTTELTPDERATLQSSAHQTTRILIDLDFDGPVLETIAQKNEHIDGSGYPGGISGDSILMTARILAVANAFVAMHSPRAYREPLTTDEALSKLYKDADIIYDKNIVAALMHVAKNKLDWL